MHQDSPYRSGERQVKNPAGASLPNTVLEGDQLSEPKSLRAKDAPNISVPLAPLWQDLIVPTAPSENAVRTNWGPGEQKMLVARTSAAENTYANCPESKSFLQTATAWQGSVTPRVVSRVMVTSVYAAVVCATSSFLPALGIPITPFEYSGAVLALLLVLRVNAGHDRWWEARKIWGSIVNQSRNLGIVVYGYRHFYPVVVDELLGWIAAWPHLMRESLRKQRDLSSVQHLIPNADVEKLRTVEHMAIYAGFKISSMLNTMRQQGWDAHAYLRSETERSLLIDAIGACERIRNTRMPLVLAIKTRRFIALFLLLLPFALVDRAGWLTPLIVALAAYPLFSLDEIGAELQNPFSSKNLSHLPLDSICSAIEGNVLALQEYAKARE